MITKKDKNVGQLVATFTWKVVKAPVKRQVCSGLSAKGGFYVVNEKDVVVNWSSSIQKLRDFYERWGTVTNWMDKP